MSRKLEAIHLEENQRRICLKNPMCRYYGPCVYTFVSDTITLCVTYEMEAELKRLPRYRKYNPKLVDMLIAQLRLRILRDRLLRRKKRNSASRSRLSIKE